jgi:DNA polymerase-3 subunit delta'
MQAGTHPDYYTLVPEKGKSALGIDAVRGITEKARKNQVFSGGSSSVFSKALAAASVNNVASLIHTIAIAVSLCRPAPILITTRLSRRKARAR